MSEEKPPTSTTTTTTPSQQQQQIQAPPIIPSLSLWVYCFSIEENDYLTTQITFTNVSYYDNLRPKIKKSMGLDTPVARINLFSDSSNNNNRIKYKPIDPINPTLKKIYVETPQPSQQSTFTCWVHYGSNIDELTFDNSVRNYNSLIPTIRQSIQLSVPQQPIILYDSDPNNNNNNAQPLDPRAPVSVPHLESSSSDEFERTPNIQFNIKNEEKAEEPKDKKEDEEDEGEEEEYEEDTFTPFTQKTPIQEQMEELEDVSTFPQFLHIKNNQEQEKHNPILSPGLYHCTDKLKVDNIKQTNTLKAYRADDQYYDKELTNDEAPDGVFFCANAYQREGILPKITVYPRKATSKISHRVLIDAARFSDYGMFYVSSTISRQNGSNQHLFVLAPPNSEYLEWLHQKFIKVESPNSICYFKSNQLYSVRYPPNIVNVFITGDVDVKGSRWDT
eukprot:gene8375-10289_t